MLAECPDTQNLSPPQALLFDWDNTLVDTWPGIHRALALTFEEMGMAPWSLDQTKARVRHALSTTFPVLFGADWLRAKEIYLGHFNAVHLDMLHPLSGAADLLAALAKARIPAAIVSNKDGPLVRKEVEFLGWSDSFFTVIGAEDAPKNKPDPTVINHCLSALDLSAGPHIWFIGDTEVDMECAAHAGLTGVALRPNRDFAAEFATYPPHLGLGDCKELLQSLTKSEFIKVA